MVEAKIQLAPSVAPGLNRVGAMLPYSPLHVLLLDERADVEAVAPARPAGPAAAGAPRVAEAPQPLLELTTRVVQPAHDGALRTLEYPADLLVGEPIHLAKKYHSAVVRGQFVDGFVEAAGELGHAGLLGREVRRLTFGANIGVNRQARVEPIVLLPGRQVGKIGRAHV